MTRQNESTRRAATRTGAQRCTDTHNATNSSTAEAVVALGALMLFILAPMVLATIGGF